MKFSKKILLTFIVSLTILAVSAGAVLAVDLAGPLTGVGQGAGFGSTAPNLAQIIGLIVKSLLSLLGIVFIGYIVYAGSLWITARGSEDQLSKAKAIIRGSIIGIIIILSAYAITDFVVDRVGQATGYNVSS